MKLHALNIPLKFIPTFRGNKDLPPEEQMCLHLVRIPGTAEESAYKSIKSDGQGNFEITYNDNYLIRTFVSRIDNFELVINGKDTKIENGSDLAGVSLSILSELFTEIRDYLFPDDDKLNAGEPPA